MAGVLAVAGRPYSRGKHDIRARSQVGPAGYTVVGLFLSEGLMVS
jgi:hypothetical protein